MGRFLSGMAVGAAGNVAAPFPVVAPSIKCNYSSLTTQVLPHPANDGKSIELTGNAINIRSAANAILYTMTAANINAAATLICGAFIDTVNGLIWAVGNNATAGAGWLAKLDYTTGTVTAVGAGFTSPVNTLKASQGLILAERAAIGAGDLTLWYGSWNFSISTTTGAVTVAEAQLLLNGVASPSNFSSYVYSTADKTLFVDRIVPPSTGVGPSSNVLYPPGRTQMDLFRNGKVSRISFDSSPVGGMGAFGLNPFPIGSNVALVGAIANNGAPSGVQYYTRASFDAWLQQIATNIGMP